MEGLPKQFLSSLKILFDILDENRTGYIRLRDIESRWSDDGVRGLPAGIVDGLRKVTPSNGLLSFDKFVSGLKLVLNSKGPRLEGENRKPFSAKENFALQSQSIYQGAGKSMWSSDYKNYAAENNTNRQRPDLHHNNNNNRHFIEGYEHQRQQQPPHSYSNTTRPPSQQQQRHQSDSNPDNYSRGFEGDKSNNKLKGFSIRQQHVRSPVNNGEVNYSNGYTIRADVSDYPNTSAPSSLQQPSQNLPSHFYSGRRGSQSNPSLQNSDKAPTIPPRSGRNPHLKKSQSGPDLHQPQSPPAVPPREHSQNSRIISDLRNWQREWTTNQNAGPGYVQGKLSAQSRHDGRNLQDRDAIYANIDQFQKKRDMPQSHAAVQQKATVRRHGSGRRHTLTSGIDQNMMKRMKQLDEETSMLRSGLSVLDSARDWYLKQLSVIADKQAMLGKVSYNDNSLEAHQERMNFQRARISEVNQQLKTLLESSEKGFPLHMNLAIANRAPTTTTPRDKANQMSVLMERNRRLMEEMNQKNDQIAQLEKEKTTLVRDLFETRSKNKAVHHDDTTFM